MINFKPISWEDKPLYEPYLHDGIERGCELSFANLYLWGYQQAAIVQGHMVLFSQFGKRLVYPYPIGQGDKKAVLDAIMADARERGISCQINSLYGDAVDTLERLYPRQFRVHCTRDAFDYVYDICDLAELAGRKYHRKRTHCNHFRVAFPDYRVAPISEENVDDVRHMLDTWYEDRLSERPDSDYQMEQSAIYKALDHYKELGMEGLALYNGEQILAMTLGSQASRDTFDVHFEKARWDVDGAYTVINNEFARYIRDKYPQIRFLNREEDMGLDGLRKSKESYYPHHMIEKCWAYPQEDTDDNR